MARIDDFIEEYRLVLEECAVAESEEKALEERRKLVFSEIVNQTEGAVTKAEHIARAHAKHVEITEALISAVTKANLIRARLKGMEVRWETWRSRNANRRAEVNMR